LAIAFCNLSCAEFDGVLGSSGRSLIFLERESKEAKRESSFLREARILFRCAGERLESVVEVERISS